MNKPSRILIADDNETNRLIFATRLRLHGYELFEAVDGEAALEAARRLRPDLILLDVIMPKIDGFEVCRRLKTDAEIPFIPIILVTAKSDSADVVAGLNAGADEYLTKPIDQSALVARVRSMLRIKDLHDQVRSQAADLAAWNHTLEQRVEEQLAQITCMDRLKRFLSPQIAQLILSSGSNCTLESHRREVAIVFCDLRGFTSFAEMAEPEEVMSVLHEYHAALGALIHKFDGTLERFCGDGIMVIFNDPLPCPDSCLRAIQMAVEMRECLGDLAIKWRSYGHLLGFGVGVAHGYATIGQIGFEGRLDYGAIGTVVNVAARLCAEAQDGQILIDGTARVAIENVAAVEPVGNLLLKGLHHPVPVFNVLSFGCKQPNRDASSYATPKKGLDY